MTDQIAYQEYIQRRYNAFCKTVIRCAALDKILKLKRQWERQVSLDYLMNEKFVQFAASEPDEEYPFTVCGQTVLLCNAALADAISVLPEQTREEILRYYFLRQPQRVIGACIGLIMVALGSLSALGYGPLAGVTVFGMQFLDFFDFLTNSVMMPIAAIAICLLVSRVIGVQKIEEEVTLGGKPFRRKKIFNFMIQYLCPIFAAIILISSVANALGWIAM